MSGIRPTDQPPRNNPKSQWARLLHELVLWAGSLIVRKDAYGMYIPPGERQTPGKNVSVVRAEPTEAVLNAHFSGGPVIGLFVLDQEGFCRFAAVDIDRHHGEGTREINEKAAIVLHDRVAKMGFSAFSEDSDGRGSFKLWLIFKEPVPARWVRSYLRWLVRDWEDLGLERDPEIFPKQDILGPGKFGNFVRLPGRHHTLEHRSLIWDGRQWLKGEAAARQILATVGSTAEVIPVEFRSDPAKHSPLSASKTARAVNGSASRLRLLKSASGALPPGFPGDYDLWIKAGMALFDLGEDGFDLWEQISRGCPEYRPGACHEKWRTFKPGGGLTYKTILRFAIQNGWKPPRRGRHDKAEYSADPGTGRHVPNPSHVEITATGQTPAHDAGTNQDALDGPAETMAEGLRHTPPDASNGQAGHSTDETDRGGGDGQSATDVFDGRKPGTDTHGTDGNGDDRVNRLGKTVEKQHSVEGPEFESTDSGLYHLTYLKEGTKRTQLASFGARIVAELTVTDGDRTHKEFRIEASLPDGKKTIEVPAEEFERMNWVYRLLGAKAVLKAGLINKDRAREAIQSVSTRIEQVTVYTHTGFVQVCDDWCFLHADGAIGAVTGPLGAAAGPRGAASDQDRPSPKVLDGNNLCPDGPDGPVFGVRHTPKSIEVRLPDALSGFRLPEPPSGQELIDAVRASLRFLEFPDDLVTYPLYALTWVGPLGVGNLTVLLDGSTGKNKSVRAGLIQQHYGAGMNWEHLPSSWSATPYALEGTAFQCKDCVITVDDWLLQGSRSDHEQAQRSAAHLIRAGANHAGRQRCSRDGSPNAGRPPRGPILITAESTPAGHSVNARLIRLVVTSGLLGPQVKPLLDRCQADADAGLYAQAMAGFVRYVASRYEQLRRETTVRVASFRDELRTKWGCIHPRTATILAKLMAAFEVFLEFAQEIGAIDQDEFQELYDRQGAALVSLVRQHNRHLQSTDPWDQFIELLSAAILSGVAHLENRLGGHPIDENPGTWGWRQEIYTVKKGTSAESHSEPMEKDVPGEAQGESSGQGDEQPKPPPVVVIEDEYEDKIRWRPQGTRIGWIYHGTVYLLPTPSLVAAQAVADKLGVKLPLTDKTLGRTAYEKGKLLESDIDTPREEYTTRHTILSKRPKVYVMKASTVLPDTSTFGAFEDLDEDESQEATQELLDPYEARQRKLNRQLEA